MLALVFLISCNTDCASRGDCKKVTIHYQLGEAKDYLVFKKGSFWVYQYSVDGALDTVTCVSDTVLKMSATGKTSSTSHITLEFEKIRSLFYSSYYRWNFKLESVNPTVNSHSEEEPYRIMLVKSVTGEGDQIPFYHPFDLNICSAQGSAFTCCRNADTSIVLNGTTFNHVVRFSHTGDELWCPNSSPASIQNPPAQFFYAKGVGLLRHENLRDHSAWNLVEYHLN